MAWDVLSGAAKMAWDVLSGVTKTAWDVLSGVANRCGMFCPRCQKLAWDVLSRDVLSYIRLKVIMYALLYVYEWTDGQVLRFVKKIRLKCKKGPFTTQTETTLVKMPQAGPKRPVNMVLGHFGHGHFGLGRFGLDISATDVSAT